MKIIKTYLIFKVYVCLIQTKVYIHIQTQRVHKDICMKARGSKGCICINNSLDKIDIYKKFKHKHKNMKQLIFIKTNFISRYMYDLSTQEVYIHIPKHNWVHKKRFAWKANDSRGIHVYLKVWQTYTYTWNENSYT